MVTAKHFIEIANAEVGYREQSGNKNKYGKAYGMDGVAWCHQFVWWCSKKAGLKEGTDFPKTASCPRGLLWFQQRGRLYRNPLPGDYIYFKWTSNKETEASHVGIVSKVAGGRVYTIEGNAGGASDRVVAKSYAQTYGCIVGYGRLPLERDDAPATPADNIDHEAVRDLQTALNTEYRLKITVDGIYGDKTAAAVKSHLLSYGKKGRYVRWVQARLTAIGYRGNMTAPDGIFGKNTRAAVRAFQKARRLGVDGVVGDKTVREMIKKV